MPTELENLRRQVAVLREACEVAGVRPELNICRKALAEAERVAAEPVDPALEDLVREWTAGATDSWVASHPGKDRILVGDLDGYVPFPSVAEAMDWVRAQGEVGK